MSRRQQAQTPKAVWSDGLHFVRRASDADPHVMRWVVGAHSVVAGRGTARHAKSLDAALATAKQLTKAALQRDPALKAHFQATPLPAASALPGPKQRRGRPPEPKAWLEPFSTYHFTCICANPFAQVWQCTSDPLERRPTGRPKATGHAPDQVPLRHMKGQCAVMFGDTPVREPDGRVRIFPLWQAADEFAEEAYYSADEDEVIAWAPGQPKVGASRFCDILFDPDQFGEHRPFALYMPDVGRLVFRDGTRPIKFGDTGRIGNLAASDPQAYLDEVERRRERSAFLRTPTFEERPLLFRSLWEAENEAARRDRMRLGETV